MIADLKPYPTMKDSGVEWLGDVPEHWDVLPVCAVATPKSVVDEAQRELLSVYLRFGVVAFSEVDEKRTNVTSQDLSRYQAVDPGDLVMNNQQAWRGSVGVSTLKGIVSPAYLVLALDDGKYVSQYANLLFRSRSMVDQYVVSSRGVGTIQRNLYWPHLRRTMTLVPPVSEQGAIVRYLDHLDRRVRRLVRAKRKLIELLEEQRHGIIHGAVTRGLDPQVPMKDSGIEWMGEVPAHWEVLALKRVLRRLIDCEHKTAPAVDGSEFRVVRTTAVRNGTYDRLGTYGTTPEAYREWTRRGVPVPGDVIFTREAPAGEACLVPGDEPVCLGQRTVLMKPRRDEYSPEFLVHMIYGGPPRIRIQLASQGSTVGHFNMDDIGWMRVYKPPLPEQLEIVDYLSDATRDIDSALARATAEIELLNEYRTRLIGDVVAGKLDVRGAAAAMPDVDPMDVVEDLADSSDPDTEMALRQLNAAPAETDE